MYLSSKIIDIAIPMYAMALTVAPNNIDLLLLPLFANFPAIGEKIAVPNVSKENTRATSVAVAPILPYAIIGIRNLTIKNPRLQKNAEL